MKEILLNHLNTIINLPLSFNRPFIQLLKNYFKQNPKLGSADRFFLKELSYLYIRNKLLIDKLTEAHKLEKYYFIYPFIKIESELTERKKQLIEDFITHTKNKIPNIDIDFTNNITPVFYNELINKFNLDNTRFLLNKLITQSPINIRLNNLNANAPKSINLKKSDLFDFSFQYLGSEDISQLEEYKNGKIEIQDEGSIILTTLIETNKNDRIIDACAGAGGKSLLLSSLNNTCDIFSYDENQKRMDELKLRFQRNKISNINVLNKSELIKLENTFDVVLIDAPCSGSGTIRRFPEKQHTINYQVIKYFSKLQSEILEYYKNYVKIGGYLYYATCSLFNLENEFVVDSFIQKNHFIFESFDISKNKFLKKQIFKSNSKLNILPFDYDGDCFFIAKLKRIK